LTVYLELRNAHLTESRQWWCHPGWWTVLVMVQPDPFRGIRAWRNSTEIQQSGHAPRSGLEVKRGRNSDRVVSGFWLIDRNDRHSSCHLSMPLARHYFSYEW